MFHLDYHSLVDAAESISGDPLNRNANDKIINAFIKLAATGQIKLLVLAPDIEGVLFGADNKPTSKAPARHRHDYYHISQSDALGYEAYRAGPRTMKQYSTQRLDLKDNSGRFVLLEGRDKITLTPYSLHILTKDMEAYRNEKGATKTIDIEGCPKGLRILFQAHAKYWRNARPDEKDTWSKNKDVSTWLQGQGYGKQTADAGATIIRPDFAEGKR